MSKKTSEITFPTVLHDFAKSNGENRFFETTGPSLCRAEFADECDINKLMARYETYGTGVNNLPNLGEPRYIDFTEIPDTLLGYMEFMDTAQNAFMTLPAHIRREFDNNAHQFVEFAADPGNVDMMVEWGLAERKPEPKPPAEPVQASAPPPPSNAAPQTGGESKAS